MFQAISGTVCVSLYPYPVRHVVCNSLPLKGWHPRHFDQYHSVWTLSHKADTALAKHILLSVYLFYVCHNCVQSVGFKPLMTRVWGMYSPDDRGVQSVIAWWLFFWTLLWSGIDIPHSCSTLTAIIAINKVSNLSFLLHQILKVLNALVLTC